MLDKSARKAETRVYIRDVWTLLLVKWTLLRISLNNTEWLWGRGRTSTKQTNKKKTIHSPTISGILSLFSANKIVDAHWRRPPDEKLDFSRHCQQEVCNPYISYGGKLLPIPANSHDLGVSLTPAG